MPFEDNVAKTLKLNSYSWTVFRLIRLLEEFGIEKAMYIHSDDVEEYLERRIHPGEPWHWFE